MKYLTCHKLRSIKQISHGFFTRDGGVSSGIYGSLNLGFGSDDDPEKITKNREIILQSLGGESLQTLYQVHSNKVVTITNNIPHQTKIKADAMVTNQPNIALGVLTADCVPVLFCDPKNKIIGAAHAGWKGAVAGITDNVIKAMEDLGADRSQIIAAIGPCISQGSYEISSDFYQDFLAESANNVRFFTDALKDGHYMFDISGYVKGRLQGYNIGTITQQSQDTYAQDDLFYSYRRSCHKNEGDYGRQISAICLGL